MTQPFLARLARRKAAHDDAAASVAVAPLRDPRGGVTTVGAALLRITQLRQAVDQDGDAGLALHRRISPGQRLLLRLLPLLDGLILLWFLTGVLNADLTRPDVTVLIAAALAVLCTVAVAAWNASVGQHLQRSKDPRTGDLVWDHLDATSWGLLVLTAVMAGLLGAMMDVRVSDEVFEAAGVPGAAATIIAVTLAVAVVLVNLYVLALSFRDGSSVTRELDQLGALVRPHLRREHRARQRAHAAERRIHVRAAAEERVTLVREDSL